MAAVTARMADRLRQLEAAMWIDDVPGVTGLQGDSGFIYVNELALPTGILASRLTGFEPPRFVLLASGVPDRLDAALTDAGWTFRRTLEMMVLPRAYHCTRQTV